VGFDKAVMAEEAAASIEATVVELLPSAVYRLKLVNEDVVVAHAAGAATVNFVRMRPGDRVRVELSPHDRTRGRIVELLVKS
jgi:translation initiation factor IF-1